MANRLKGRSMPSNPLGVIALFVFFIEVIATVSLKIVVGTPYTQFLVYFIVLYPVGITLLFFIILWFRREVLFGPMDYREDRTFKDILMRKVEAIEVKQEARNIEVTTNLRYVYNTIDRLIYHKEVESTLIVGRIFLKNGEYDISYELFQYIRSKIDPQNEHYCAVLGNIAFSLNKKGEYREALEHLSLVESINEGRGFFAWHMVARAYAIYKSAGNKTEEYWQAIESAKARSEYKLDLHNAKKYYPEIKEDLSI